MGQAERENTIPPFTAFRFEIVLTLRDLPEGVSNPVCDAAFSECTGLDMSMEPKLIPNTGFNEQQFFRISPVTYGRLTLRRGMTENLHLWKWFAAAAKPGKDVTASGQITLFNPDGKPTIIFKLEECLPVKISGPSLNAQTGQVAMEELQLVYAKLTIDLPDQAGSGTNPNSTSGGLKVSGGPGLSSGASR